MKAGAWHQQTYCSLSLSTLSTHLTQPCTSFCSHVKEFLAKNRKARDSAPWMQKDIANVRALLTGSQSAWHSPSTALSGKEVCSEIIPVQL